MKRGNIQESINSLFIDNEPIICQIYDTLPNNQEEFFPCNIADSIMMLKTLVDNLSDKAWEKSTTVFHSSGQQEIKIEENDYYIFRIFFPHIYVLIEELDFILNYKLGKKELDRLKSEDEDFKIISRIHKIMNSLKHPNYKIFFKDQHYEFFDSNLNIGNSLQITENDENIKWFKENIFSESEEKFWDFIRSAVLYTYDDKFINEKNDFFTLEELEELGCVIWNNNPEGAYLETLEDINKTNVRRYGHLDDKVKSVFVFFSENEIKISYSSKNSDKEILRKLYAKLDDIWIFLPTISSIVKKVRNLLIKTIAIYKG